MKALKIHRPKGTEKNVDTFRVSEGKLDKFCISERIDA